MSLNIQTATGLLEIGGNVTKEKVISALGYEPADKAHTEDKTVHVTSAEKETWNNKSDFSGAYADLIDAPNITENDSGNMVIADESGNIIMQVDADGLSTTNVNTKTIKLDGEDLGTRLDELESSKISGIVEDESGKVEFADEVGNVIARINADGLETTTVTAESAVIGGVDIGTKLDEYKEAIDDVSGDLTTHTSNSTVHITADERTSWNNKSDFSGDYNDLTNAPDIKEDASGEVVYADESGNVIAKIGENGFETTQVIADTVVVNGVNVEEKFTQVNERIDNISIPSTEGLATEVYVDKAVAGIVNSAPETLDTLNELATALGDDPNFATTVATQIGLKADKTALDTHTSNKVVHITADERAAWNAKSDFSGDYNDLENAPNITEDSSDSVVYADEAGNIIAKIDASGFETTTVTAQKIMVNGTDLEAKLDEKFNEAKTDASNKDAVILLEAQKGISALQTYVDEGLSNKAGTSHTHEEYLTASDIADKADKTELHEHSNKTELDKITDGKVESWDNKSDFSGDYNDLENAPNIYEDGSDNLVIADQQGNIIFRSDANGFETTTLTAKNVVVNGVDVEIALDGKAASEHTHNQYLEASDIDGFATKEYVNAQLETKAGTNHAHEQYLTSDDIVDKTDKTYVDAELTKKADKVHTHEEYLTSDDIINKTDKTYVDGEIATAIAEVKADAANKDAVVLFEAQKGISDVQSALDTHTDKTNIHITDDERTAWNGKADKIYVDTELVKKADRATTLEGYGITDAASKEYVDTLIEGLTTEGTADAALVQAALKAHTNDKANPHAVTLTQLGVEATYAELNHVMGVTSNIQTQLDNKAGKSEVSTLKSNILDGTVVAAEATHADIATSAQTADNALIAAKDGMGRLLHETYETKTDASNKAAVVLAQAQAYTDSKQDIITGAATTIVSDDLEANRVLISNGSGKVATHGVTAAELAHLLGVKSNIQTQLDAKVNSSTLDNYYTKTEIDDIELITVEDIDRICGMTT